MPSRLRLGLAPFQRLPVALQTLVRLPERHRAVVFLSLLRRQIGLARRDELLLGGAFLDPPSPRVEPLAQLAEVPADVVRERRSGSARAARERAARSPRACDTNPRCRRPAAASAAAPTGSAGSALPLRRPRRASCRRSSRRGGRHGPARGRPRAPRPCRSAMRMFSSGTGASSPQSSSNVSPYSRRALRSSRDGSARCGAPISDTQTVSSGCSRTSTPAAPAWSRWICERSSRLTSPSSCPRSASPAFRAATHDVGPQSKRDSPPDVSRRYAPTVRAVPVWNRSIGCSALAK